MTVAVIIISDRAARGEYQDLSGPEIVTVLNEYLPNSAVRQTIVSDDPDAITAALVENAGIDFIITTGGTGIGPRDITPRVTTAYCDSLLPGIAEILRAESYKETPNAMLSRGVAGIKNGTIIVNFPGSVKAVRLCTRVLAQVMEHALDMMEGAGH